MISTFLLASLRWFLVGACWSGGEKRPLGAAAGAIALSIPICLLVTILLAALGLYRVPLELGVLLAIAVAGIFRTRPRIRSFLPGLLALNLLVALVLLMPSRMQWIAGGWDPGTYVSEGASVVHEGGWERPPERFLQFLDEETRALFTRDRFGFLELMPVVPLEHEDGAPLATKPFFFPLFPAMLASAHSAAEGLPQGGLALSTHVNFLLGGLTVFLFGMALGRFDWRLGVAGAVLLAAHPLLVYHLNFPTSEVLHLFLMVSLFYWLGQLRSQPETRWGALIALALVFFLGPLNRLDFLLFGSVLLLALALADSRGDRPLKQGLLELFLLAAAMALGTGLSLHVAEAAVARLGKDVSLLVVGGTVFTGGAMVLRLIAAPVRAAFLPRFWDWVSDHLHWGLAAVVLLGFAAVWFVQAPKSDQPFIWQLNGMWWYLTWPSVALAALGFFSLEWERLPRAFGVWMLAVAAMVLLVLVFGKIHQTWPWAARRYVPTLLPLLVGLGAWGVCQTRWVGMALLAAACGLNAPRVLQAWRVMDDENRLGAELAAVVDQLQPNDLVVSDHFVWAVPLRFLFGVQVINGERFDDTKKFPAQLAAIESWPGRVLWLTSTGQGLSAFPGPIPSTEKMWEGESFEYRKIKRANYVGGFTEAQRKRYENVIEFFVRGYEQARPNPKRFVLWKTPAKPFPDAGPDAIYINVGDESAKPYLGAGWSRPEGARDDANVWHDAQWIKRMEADVHFELPEAVDCDVVVRAMPLYDKRLRQNVGLYANGQYVDEWLCPTTNHYEVCTTLVPASHLQPGTNTLTFRVGYVRKGPGKDTRKLGLQVDKIVVRPRGKRP